MTNTPEYKVWAGMWDRCTNPKAPAYERYKDRAPPKRWLKFENFIADMGLRPEGKYTLERKKNDQPYGPGNCVWATRGTQSRNQSRNVNVVFQGQQMCVSDACKAAGVKLHWLRYRLGKGMTMLEASEGQFQGV